MQVPQPFQFSGGFFRFFFSFMFLFFCLLDRIAWGKTNQHIKQPFTMLGNTTMLQNLRGAFMTVTLTFLKGFLFPIFLRTFPLCVLFKFYGKRVFYGTNGCL